MKWLSIVWSSRKNWYREEYDFYPTPWFVVEELLKREHFNWKILEPCCWDWSISNVLIENWYKVDSFYIIDRWYGKVQDFLKYDWITDNIITNPPYKNSLDFILKAKSIANSKIAFFMKTVWLESESRYDMFNDKYFPLKTVYQFSKRISLYKNWIKTKNWWMIAYAWYVFDKDYKWKPTIEWIL